MQILNKLRSSSIDEQQSKTGSLCSSSCSVERNKILPKQEEETIYSENDTSDLYSSARGDPTSPRFTIS